MPRPGIYRHYKGHEYRYIGVAKHSETLEEFVIYERIKGDQVVGCSGGQEAGEGGQVIGWSGDQEYWARPKAMFEENVIIDGLEKPRFEWIRDS